MVYYKARVRNIAIATVIPILYKLLKIPTLAKTILRALAPKLYNSALLLNSLELKIPPPQLPHIYSKLTLEHSTGRKGQ